MYLASGGLEIGQQESMGTCLVFLHPSIMFGVLPVMCGYINFRPQADKVRQHGVYGHFSSK